MSAFGERLKNIRLSKGMSQDEFAALLGTSKQVISRYENNLRVPKLTIATKYAEALNISLSELVEDAEQPADSDGLLEEFDRLFGKLSDEKKAVIIATMRAMQE